MPGYLQQLQLLFPPPNLLNLWLLSFLQVHIADPLFHGGKERRKKQEADALRTAKDILLGPPTAPSGVFQAVADGGTSVRPCRSTGPFDHTKIGGGSRKQGGLEHRAWAKRDDCPSSVGHGHGRSNDSGNGSVCPIPIIDTAKHQRHPAHRPTGSTRAATTGQPPLQSGAYPYEYHGRRGACRAHATIDKMHMQHTTGQLRWWLVPASTFSSSSVVQGRQDGLVRLRRRRRRSTAAAAAAAAAALLLPTWTTQESESPNAPATPQGGHLPSGRRAESEPANEGQGTSCRRAIFISELRRGEAIEAKRGWGNPRRMTTDDGQPTSFPHAQIC